MVFIPSLYQREGDVLFFKRVKRLFEGAEAPSKKEIPLPQPGKRDKG
jgi:hypothetical protein